MTCRPLRRRAGPGLAALAVLAVLMGTTLAIGPAPPAHAQATTPVLEVVTQTAYVSPGQPFRITLRTTGLDLDRSAITVAVGRVVGGAPVPEDREELRADDQAQQLLVRALLGGNVVSRRPVPPRAAADGNGLLTIVIPTRGPATTAAELAADPPPITLAPGVWPVAIEVRHPDQSPQTLLTHLVVVPETTVTPPLTVTVVVPLSAERPPLRPDQRVVLDALDRSRLRTLMERVQAFPSVVLAVSPQLVDALERSSNGDDLQLLNRLRGLATTNTVLALPYVDVDVEAWRTAGLTEELRGILAAGRTTLARVLGIDPLTDTVITPPSTTPETLELLAELGFSRFVFGEDQLEPLRREQWRAPVTKIFVVRDAQGEPRAGVSTDPELRRLFAGDSVLNAHRLVADLSAAWFDGATANARSVREERRGVIVVVPDDWSAAAQFLNVVVDSLAANPILRSSGFPTLFGSSPASRSGDRVPFTLVDGVLERKLTPAPPNGLDLYPMQLRDINARLGSFEAMLPTTDTARQTLRTLVLVSADGSLAPEQRGEYLTAVSRSVADATGGLSFARSSTYTLTARTDSIPIIVENSSTTTLKGRIELRTDPRIEFPDLRRSIAGTWLLDDIDLLPGTNRLDVRVRTLTSGESTFEAVVTSPDGGLGPLATTRLRVRSVALSGVGLAISVLALAVLMTWWFRHHRTQRRLRTTVS